MAATDISALIAKTPGRFEFQTPIRWGTYEIDVTAAAFSGIETAATHNLVSIPKGQALVKGYAFVETAFTSAGAATVQFKVGAETLTGVLPKADLAAGDVIELSVGDKEDAAGAATYAKAAAATLDWTVGTAALTAGKVVLLLGFVDVSAILNNG